MSKNRWKGSQLSDQLVTTQFRDEEIETDFHGIDKQVEAVDSVSIIRECATPQ